jgi:leucine dehydrogenase
MGTGCALGAVLNRHSIPELGCAAIVGSANNQLDTEADALRLAERGILYAPDFVANAGGVINIAEEPHGYDRTRAYERISTIHTTLLNVFARAEAERTTPSDAANRLAEDRIRAVGQVKLLRGG